LQATSTAGGHDFWCLLFCISLSKAEMTKIFNAFRSKNPFSFSVVSVCSNCSVCHSIKKAAAPKKVLGIPQQFL
jgi:hypothetical protein